MPTVAISRSSARGRSRYEKLKSNEAGGEAPEDDGEPFEEKMMRLTVMRREWQAEAERLGAAIAENLRELGFSG